ncbi:HNH/ENDO VII family nuclease [Rapidithrix thailandica]|uniref:HNH/ENDO VII family nuclease n=1 Tax=Rapidithrix thailandica TaxID=413964 RepID=A0AAW9S907_9BACT
MEYDIYGNIRSQTKGEQHFIPFRNQGQYEDVETGLYYNRFRYYSPESGAYISQDPIGLAGNNPNIYAYTHDSNTWIDPFGLSKFNPIEIFGRKVYQNTTDFVTGVPNFVDPVVGKTNPYAQAILDNGGSNLDLMKKGYAPIGTDGKQINLHHIIGIEPGPMIELLEDTHQKYSETIHAIIEDGRSFRKNKKLKRAYERFRKKYWKQRAKGFKVSCR